MSEIEKKTNWTLDDRELTRNEVAYILGITDRQLYRLIPEMPDEAKASIAGLTEWYWQEQKGSRVFESLKEEKLFHDTRRSRIIADKEQLQLEVEKKKYVEREGVEHRIAAISKEFSAKLFAFPARVASLVMQAKTEAEVKKRLDTELRKITAEIDQMAVFPDE